MATKKRHLPQAKTNVPEGELELPELFDTVKTLAQVVPVRIFMSPGVRRQSDLILKVMELFATGKLPEVGATIASDKTLLRRVRPDQGEKEGLQNSTGLIR